jgi:hypothetical protein
MVVVAAGYVVYIQRWIGSVKKTEEGSAQSWRNTGGNPVVQ